MKKSYIKQAVEALLMAAARPLKGEELVRLVSTEKEKVTAGMIRKALADLVSECQGRGIELVEVASGYRYQTRHEFSLWLAKLWEEKPPRYSRALLETLALIAYQQPLTRAEIEEVRGVSVSSSTMHILQERAWVKISGHKEVPGRPALYVTTKDFLDYFNLRSLDELPALMDYEKVMQLHPELKMPEVSIAAADGVEDDDAVDTGEQAEQKADDDSGLNEESSDHQTA